jgi:anti-sigma-K factor RskA
VTLALESEAPPPAVWRGIETRLFAEAAPARRRAPRRVSWGVPAAVAAGLAALLLLRPGAAPPPSVSVLDSTGVTLAGEVLPESFVASLAGDGRTLVTRPVQPVAVPATLSLQLWSVAPGGAPRSLGIVSAKEATVLHPEPAPDPRGFLVVSLEPASGSPTGAPSGPVLWRGRR